MAGPFDLFVVLAEMRTGSNFLETNLNALDGIICHGEAFNPHFIGYPNRADLLGITRAERDAAPERLIGAIRAQTQGIGGFRFFHDHDPRAFDLVIGDPRCAKIVLTRNPVDSYVSLAIAQATGQWKLTDVSRRRDSRITFDSAEFEAHLERIQGFQIKVLSRLQTSGQTAFYLGYDDLRNLDVMNGLAQFLGCRGRLERLDASLKKQNPAPLQDKVANFEEMSRALARLDRFDLSRTPNFEPRRGPAVPGFVCAARAPLLYMPVRSGPEAQVRRWLAALDDVSEEALRSGFTQKDLRQWMRGAPGHRRFTVLRHPVARAHAAFCDRILNTGPGCFRDIRRTLRKGYGLPLPEGDPGPGYDLGTHRAAFLGFLTFLKANLAGQTGIRVDAHWATQASVLEGMASVALPDVVLRESEMPDRLTILARDAGYANPPEVSAPDPDRPFALAEIHDEEIEGLARDVYQRDYLTFGFSDWSS